jgi:hypothetical protein
MQLLITASKPTTLWKLEGSTAKKLYLRDFTYYNLEAENTADLGTLPQELSQTILDTLFNDYLLDRDFDAALKLCTTSKYFLKRFYERIYGCDDLNTRDLYKRLARSFVFMEAIDDYLVSEKIGSLNCALRICRPGFTHMVTPVKPWHFGKYSCKEAMAQNFYRGDLEMKNFNTGPAVCDIVWLNGLMRNGVMHTVEFYHPVINIILCDSTDNVIPSAETIEENEYMKSFARLVSFIYGPTTIINFMIKEEENPFLVTTDAFITF